MQSRTSKSSDGNNKTLFILRNDAQRGQVSFPESDSVPEWRLEPGPSVHPCTFRDVHSDPTGTPYSPPAWPPADGTEYGVPFASMSNSSSGFMGLRL